MREEIVSLCRGAFAVPLLSFLAERGMLDEMRLRKNFQIDDFPAIKNKQSLRAAFCYLASLGYLAHNSTSDAWSQTDLGIDVFEKAGICLLLDSYRNYFQNVKGLLEGEVCKPAVDRNQNTMASGQLHARKFFPTAKKLLENRRYSHVADIGCGDGTFLEYAMRCNIGGIPIAVDNSVIAINQTRSRLSGRSLIAIVSDGIDIDKWVDSCQDADRLLISMWFVIHEFAAGSALKVINFLTDLHNRLPHAELLIGEITSPSPAVLAEHHSTSIMPEMIFFHQLSGQGVLKWPDFEEIRMAIPYRLAAQKRFDELVTTDNSSTPSSFIWHLTPQE